MDLSSRMSVGQGTTGDARQSTDEGAALLSGDEAQPGRIRFFQMWMALLAVSVLLLGIFTFAFGFGSAQGDHAPRDRSTSAEDIESEKVDGPGLEFKALGTGSCIDTDGDRLKRHSPVRDVDVLTDGKSPECERLCAAEDTCKGFETEAGGQCTLMTDKVYPSSADDADGRHCFWRHPFLRNSSFPSKQHSIPNIIWGFWQNLPDKDGKVAKDLPYFINICVSTWRTLNPKWEIRLLDETSKFDWLEKDDLPKMYEHMDVQHRADSIRLALMLKHGGVWLDASTMVWKPMEELLGGDLTKSTFFTIYHSGNDVQEGLKLGVHERRVDMTDYVENWFFSSAPNNPLFDAAHRCIMKFYSEKGSKDRMINSMHQFSDRQMEELRSLRCDNGYLTTHACIVKTMDEDAGIQQWWHSEHVRKLDTRDTALWWVNKTSMVKLVVARQPDLYDGVMKRGIMKFFGYHTNQVRHMAERMLWCGPGTLHQLLTATHVTNKSICEKLGAPHPGFVR